MNRQELLTEIFNDTMDWINTTPVLKNQVENSINNTKIYMEDTTQELKSEKRFETQITVTSSRSFEAAMHLKKENPDSKVAVHNFASATNPGGGVTRGCSAQEECLCRCSTLFPVLSHEKMRRYYNYHRNRHDVRYSDACIYSPDISVIKSDKDIPQRLPENEWCVVDIITCAAPNLREKTNNRMNPSNAITLRLTDSELMELHIKRARAMLTIAANNGTEILVLGAFGCGAFSNNPFVVANAYKRVLPEFMGYFSKIEFAVYCSPRDKTNYDVFKRVLGN